MRRLAAVCLCGALALVVACAEEEAAPVSAAKAFVSAVQRRNVESMLELVDGNAVQRLEQAAERASDQVGGRRNIEPHEMLQVVDVDPRFQVVKAELLTADGETARVRLLGADETEHTLDLINEDGAWKVRIPLP